MFIVAFLYYVKYHNCAYNFNSIQRYYMHRLKIQLTQQPHFFTNYTTIALIYVDLSTYVYIQYINC